MKILNEKVIMMKFLWRLDKKPLKTRFELQLCFDYTQRNKPWKCYWEWIKDILEKRKIIDLMNIVLSTKPTYKWMKW